jgi:hypothetical protein
VEQSNDSAASEYVSLRHPEETRLPAGPERGDDEPRTPTQPPVANSENSVATETGFRMETKMASKSAQPMPLLRKPRNYQRMMKSESLRVQPKCRLSSSNNDDPRPTKNPTSTCLPVKAGAEQTAWCQDAPDSRDCSKEKQYASADDAGIELEPAVMYWSSRWSAWVIGLTGPFPRSSGSTRTTTRSCGARDACTATPRASSTKAPTPRTAATAVTRATVQA